MGGSAFSAILSATAFPRIPPSIYHALKARLIPKISQLYNSVGVPIEAPEKQNYGDLDFLVCNPRSPQLNTYIPHETIKRALGAELVIPQDANRTSNYAIPIPNGEWHSFGHGLEENNFRKLSENAKIYYQVDVHPCVDSNEFDRILFFNSYGDLGMIPALIAKANGLHLGSKGLKILDPPNPHFNLSDSFVEICEFLDLSLEPFYTGFKTKHDVFVWATSMKYFDVKHLPSTSPKIEKIEARRSMYAQFIEWVKDKQPHSALHKGHSDEERIQKIREDALAFFSKKYEFDDLVHQRLQRLRFKKSFSGNRVREWTQINDGVAVKLIMDEVRHRLGGEQGVWNFLDEHSEDALKAFVHQVQTELCLHDISLTL